MKLSRIASLIAALTVVISVACATASSELDQPELTVSATPVRTLSPTLDASGSDLELVAETNGWTIEEAATHFRAGEVVGHIAGQIAAERPDIFVGAALSPEPGGAPKLYIKGPADEFIRNLVATAEIDIKVVDNQPYSGEELHERTSQLNQALQDMGFSNFAVSSDITAEGRLDAAVTREPGLPDDPVVIVASLPASLRDAVRLSVSDTPVGVDQ